jgi:hypothetical protein
MILVPEMGCSRWGEGLTADDMKKCAWVICRCSTHFTDVTRHCPDSASNYAITGGLSSARPVVWTQSSLHLRQMGTRFIHYLGWNALRCAHATSYFPWSGSTLWRANWSGTHSPYSVTK